MGSRSKAEGQESVRRFAAFFILGNVCIFAVEL